jgi:hypothetical protein
LTGFAFGPIRQILALSAMRCEGSIGSSWDRPDDAGAPSSASANRSNNLAGQAHQIRRPSLRPFMAAGSGGARAGHALGRIIIAGARAGGRQSGRLGGRKGFGNARPFASHHSHSAQPSRYTVTPSVPITMAISIRRSTGLRDDTSVPPLCWQQPRQSAAHLRTRN